MINLILRKYWFELITIIFAVYVGIYISALKKENRALTSSVREKEAQLMAQNILIDRNKSDYENKLKELPKVITKIETKYKTIHEKIYEWRGKNEIDCNASLDYLNRFEY